MRTTCALAAHLRALAVCKALFTSPRGVHPRGAFLCNRNGVSYYTKKETRQIRISSVPLELVLRNDFFFVVRATVLAYSVRHHQLSTLAAFY